MKNKIEFFAGIDVQINRGCCYYIINQNKRYVKSGWMTENIPQSFKKLFQELTNFNYEKIAIGIDAPRMPIKKPRQRYYDKIKNEWIIKKKKSIGRECEVIINSFKIANCQWTNTLEKSPNWMKLGYKIYSELRIFPYVYEVFPSASYNLLKNENFSYELCLNEFVYGVKDMLDASVSAITVYEYLSGHGCEVGGADGLGTVILPRKIPGLVA